MKKTILILIVALLSFSCEVKVAEKPQRKEKLNTGGNIPPNSATLTEITIPEGVTRISEFEFADKELAEITLPKSLTYIGIYAFFGNELTSVTLPKGVTYIGLYAFASNELTSVTIPEGVTHIGVYAFAFNKLTSVTIPEGVTRIGEYAFYNNKLTKVVMSTELYNTLKDAKTLSEIFSSFAEITFTDHKGNTLS